MDEKSGSIIYFKTIQIENSVNRRMFSLILLIFIVGMIIVTKCCIDDVLKLYYDFYVIEYIYRITALYQTIYRLPISPNFSGPPSV
jgi:hypothetical protein